MRKIHFMEDEYYHLFNRGVDKRTVFETRDDYERFRAYLFLLNNSSDIRPANIFSPQRKMPVFSTRRGSPLVAIGAYCLMPSHFHLLVTPVAKNGVSKFMHKVMTAYTMYFNLRTEREGSLFQGTFQAHHLKTDRELQYMFAYIHVKPSKKIKELMLKQERLSPDDIDDHTLHYPYSSIAEYSNANPVITSPEKYPSPLGNSYLLKENMAAWLRGINP